MEKQEEYILKLGLAGVAVMVVIIVGDIIYSLLNLPL